MGFTQHTSGPVLSVWLHSFIKPDNQRTPALGADYALSTQLGLLSVVVCLFRNCPGEVYHIRDMSESDTS